MDGDRERWAVPNSENDENASRGAEAVRAAEHPSVRMIPSQPKDRTEFDQRIV